MTSQASHIAGKAPAVIIQSSIKQNKMEWDPWAQIILLLCRISCTFYYVQLHSTVHDLGQFSKNILILQAWSETNGPGAAFCNGQWFIEMKKNVAMAYFKTTFFHVIPRLKLLLQMLRTHCTSGSF
jgi:hypothetical protein